MPFFICIIPVCPVRLQASHRSEQVSQLLFGEICEALETGKDFVRVKCLYDDYEGWCQLTQLTEINDEQASIKNNLLAAGWINEVELNNKPMQIPFGSSLSLFNNNSEATFGSYHAIYKGEIWDASKTKVDDESIKNLSHKYVNTSYLWGGKSVFGVDCSGFCQTVFKCLNIRLHRDACEQATQGEAIGFLQEARCGDLAFFDNEEGKITHVGILLGDNTIIHSSGKVRIDTIDHAGIISSDTGLRTHKLRVIRRVICQ